MEYLCDLTAEEKSYIDKLTSFINHETFDDMFMHAGKFAICSNEQDWHDRFNPCCGISVNAIYLPTGKRVFFCFDYGH